MRSGGGGGGGRGGGQWGRRQKGQRNEERSSLPPSLLRKGIMPPSEATVPPLPLLPPGDFAVHHGGTKSREEEVLSYSPSPTKRGIFDAECPSVRRPVRPNVNLLDGAGRPDTFGRRRVAGATPSMGRSGGMYMALFQTRRHTSSSSHTSQTFPPSPLSAILLLGVFLLSPPDKKATCVRRRPTFLNPSSLATTGDFGNLLP